MKDDDLVVVAACASIQEASLLQMALEEKGISSCVGGAETAAALWHYGTALGGVKVLTARRYAATANEVLSSRHAERSQTAEWTCKNCRSTVDAGFDVCWKCGRSIDEVQAGAFTTRVVEEIAAADETDSSAANDDNDDNDQPSGEVNELEQRAFRSAVFGLMFFPIIFYSMYLLVRQSLQSDEHPTSWRFAAAVAVNVLAFIAWWSFLMR
jgi:hypothetical protein